MAAVERLVPLAEQVVDDVALGVHDLPVHLVALRRPVAGLANTELICILTGKHSVNMYTDWPGKQIVISKPFDDQ